MTNKFYALKHYLKYLLAAKSKYSIHSPFVFKFVQNVLENEGLVDRLKQVKKIRKEISRQNDPIFLTDHGTGKNTGKKVSISKLVNSISVSHKYGKLLFYFTDFIKPKKVLEIGSGIGISSLYLALGNPGTEIVSLEGDPEKLRIAKKNANKLELTNIRFVEGLFEESLQDLSGETFDLIFIDGNHSYDATLSYYKALLPMLSADGVMIFDDIYWSEEMTRAWEDLKKQEDVNYTIDVFQFGILLFSRAFRQKQDEIVLY